VVVAMADPHPLVNGRGLAYLRAHNVQVDLGVGSACAHSINQPFLTAIAAGRPFVILKAATSQDGRIAARPGERTVLTSDAANRHAHRVRAEVDAIAVGSGTILADDPLLTARAVFRERPLARVIFDRRLRTPARARVLSTLGSGPVMIVTTAESAASPRAGALAAAGAEIIASDGSVRTALEALYAKGITSLLLEGGARLHAAAWDDGVVDYVRLYVTPHVLGADGVQLLNGRRFASAFLADRRIEPLGVDVVIEGYVHGPR
jgi:diaminohydroxyphosphoribosylaminopyrimidine deaminase / 5-amino-6-(5-phosphoribosylamino)uracil reductase